MNRFYKTIVTVFSTLLFLSAYRSNTKIQPLMINHENAEAIKYVGNIYSQNGIAQLELLLQEGLMPNHKVLEIGCGALVAGIPIMQYLHQGNFVGIDPNRWLIEASLRIDENKNIVDMQRPQFFYNSNFDGSEAKIEFDYILAHSIMSHAPLWQLKLFLKNCSQALQKGGRVVFSVRLTEENPYDGLGIKNESTTHEWQYPGNTFFHKQTIIDVASLWFSEIIHKPEYRDIIMVTDKGAFHDWFVATK